MSARSQGGVLLIVGVVLLVLSAAADWLGIGGFPGVGWKQILGIAAGAVVAVAGFCRLRRTPA
jgi:hypothetical protein